MASLLNERTPTGLLIAQTIGITASAYLLGGNCTLSFIAVPAAMQAPAPLAVRQWHTILTRGGSFGIPGAIISALSLGYVAYNQDPQSSAFKLNLAASLLMPSIIPFTLIFIAPTNNKLIEKMNSMAGASLEDKAVEKNVAKGETVHALIDKWATLNLARAVLIGAGAICAVVAAVDKREVFGFSGIGLRSGANRM